MDKSNEIKPCSDEALTIFNQYGREIIEKAKKKALQDREAVEAMGADGAQKLHAGFEMMNSILEAVMAVGELSLLKDQLEWGNERLPHEGISPHYLLSTFKVYCEIIEEVLPLNISAQIVPYLTWMIHYQEAFIKKILK